MAILYWEAYTNLDPRTGELLVNNNEIKRASLEYCIEKLRTDSPDKDIAALVNERKDKQLKIINDKNREGFEFWGILRKVWYSSC